MASVSCLVCPNEISSCAKMFFPFPLDPSMRLAWFEKIAQPPTSSTQIYCCSDHFLDSDMISYIENGKKTVALKVGAIPSLNLNEPQKNIIKLISSPSGTNQTQPYNIIGNVVNVVTHPLPCVQEKEYQNVVEPKLRVRKDLIDPKSNSNSKKAIENFSVDSMRNKLSQQLTPKKSASNLDPVKKTTYVNFVLMKKPEKVEKALLEAKSLSQPEIVNINLKTSAVQNEETVTISSSEDESAKPSSSESLVKVQESKTQEPPKNKSKNKKKEKFSTSIKEVSPQPSTSKSSDSYEGHEKNKAKPMRRKSINERLSSCDEDFTQEEFEGKINLVQKEYSTLIHQYLKMKLMMIEKKSISPGERKTINRSINSLIAKYKLLQSDLVRVSTALSLPEVVPDLETRLKDLVEIAGNLKVAGASSIPKRKLCCVPKCQSDSIKFPIKLFFAFPQKSHRRAQWLSAIQVNFSNTSDKFVCDDHFTIEDIENFYKSDYEMIPKLSIDKTEEKLTINEAKLLQNYALKWESKLRSLIDERYRIMSMLSKRYDELGKRTRPVSEMLLKCHEKYKNKLSTLQKRIENMTFLRNEEVEVGVEIEKLISGIERLYSQVGKGKSQEKPKEENDSRKCFVSGCTNCDISTPFKIFIVVPREPKSRELWFKAAGIKSKAFSKDIFYCCEDHFAMKDLQELCKNEESKNTIFPSLLLNQNSTISQLPSQNNHNNSRMPKPKLSCCVPSCPSKEDQKRFFIVPSAPEMRKKWFKSIGFTPKSQYGRHYVCENHFVESDFKPGLKGKYLKPTSVPEIKKDIEMLKTEVYSHIDFMRFLKLMTPKSFAVVEPLYEKSKGHVLAIHKVFLTFNNMEETLKDVERHWNEIKEMSLGTLDLFSLTFNSIQSLELNQKFKDVLVRVKDQSVCVISDSEEDDVQNESSKDSNSVKSNDCCVISDDEVTIVDATIVADKEDDVVLLSSDDEGPNEPPKSPQSDNIGQSDLVITSVVECNSLQAFDDHIIEDNEIDANLESKDGILDSVANSKDGLLDSVANSKDGMLDNVASKDKIEENNIEEENNQKEVDKPIESKKPEKRKSALDIDLSDLEDDYYEEPELILRNESLDEMELTSRCEDCKTKNKSDLCPKCIPIQFSETMIVYNEFGENPKFCEKCGDEIDSECPKCVRKSQKVAKKTENYSKRLRMNYECPICFKAFRTKNNLESHIDICS